MIQGAGCQKVYRGMCRDVSVGEKELAFFGRPAEE